MFSLLVEGVNLSPAQPTHLVRAIRDHTQLDKCYFGKFGMQIWVKNQSHPDSYFNLKKKKIG